jgi:deoxycytidylate deaminase
MMILRMGQSPFLSMFLSLWLMVSQILWVHAPECGAATTSAHTTVPVHTGAHGSSDPGLGAASLDTTPRPDNRFHYDDLKKNDRVGRTSAGIRVSALSFVANYLPAYTDFVVEHAKIPYFVLQRHRRVATTVQRSTDSDTASLKAANNEASLDESSAEPAAESDADAKMTLMTILIEDALEERMTQMKSEIEAAIDDAILAHENSSEGPVWPAEAEATHWNESLRDAVDHLNSTLRAHIEEQVDTHSANLNSHLRLLRESLLQNQLSEAEAQRQRYNDELSSAIRRVEAKVQAEMEETIKSECQRAVVGAVRALREQSEHAFEAKMEATNAQLVNQAAEEVVARLLANDGAALPWNSEQQLQEIKHTVSEVLRRTLGSMLGMSAEQLAEPLSVDHMFAAIDGSVRDFIEHTVKHTLSKDHRASISDLIARIQHLNDEVSACKSRLADFVERQPQMGNEWDLPSSIEDKIDEVLSSSELVQELRRQQEADRAQIEQLEEIHAELHAKLQALSQQQGQTVSSESTTEMCDEQPDGNTEMAPVDNEDVAVHKLQPVPSSDEGGEHTEKSEDQSPEQQLQQPNAAYEEVSPSNNDVQRDNTRADGAVAEVPNPVLSTEGRFHRLRTFAWKKLTSLRNSNKADDVDLEAARRRDTHEVGSAPVRKNEYASIDELMADNTERIVRIMCNVPTAAAVGSGQNDALSSSGHSCSIYLLGMLHISNSSETLVQEALRLIPADFVCLELCEARLSTILLKDDLSEDNDSDESSSLSLWQVLRESGYGLRLRQLITGIHTYIQQSSAASYGSALGLEQVVAARAGLERNATVVLCDRDYEVTLERLYSRMTRWEKIKGMLSVTLIRMIVLAART